MNFFKLIKLAFKLIDLFRENKEEIMFLYKIYCWLKIVFHKFREDYLKLFCDFCKRAPKLLLPFLARFSKFNGNHREGNTLDKFMLWLKRLYKKIYELMRVFIGDFFSKFRLPIIQ